ncbi:MAG: nickel pincer cofactor biosynthesis protein LarB [Lachnospiraceae bacterium]|nr:nickel pincer cofactor biosynthesis protein LarB [Lachnospiraceae bacterium]
MTNNVKIILENLKAGKISVDDALLELKKAPFVDLDFAKIDTQRSLRQGAGEVIYGAGKTAKQIANIAKALLENGEKSVLITRIDKDKASLVSLEIGSFKYYEDAQIGIVGDIKSPDTEGTILIATGGTSDIPVAEEAALTAEFLGNRVARLYDVGVAGLHRLLSHTDEIMSASVIVVIAGMEGALCSVIAGLADCPVIAVPTSVGYGASFDGLAALLSMLNCCSSGVSVVNIDNGFGAAYQASMINHIG